MALLNKIAVKGTDYPIVTDDGYYQEMAVGAAEQLISTVSIDDSVPYNFRTAGGSVDIGNRVTEEIVGGTIAWNQLVKNPIFENGVTNWSAARVTAAFDNGVATVTITGTNDPYFDQSRELIAGHKYLAIVDVMNTSESISWRIMCFYNNASSYRAFLISNKNTWYTISAVIDNTVSGSYNPMIRLCPNGGQVGGETAKIRNPRYFDLTQMFGSTIADYIYSLETANAGAGVAWFKKLFPKPYYAYDAGSLQSVQAVNHITTGFNQCNEVPTIGWFWRNGTLEKNWDSSAAAIEDKIHCMPLTTYCVSFPKMSRPYSRVFLSQFDATGSFIKSKYVDVSKVATFTTDENVYYITVTLYRGEGDYVPSDFEDFCINLSWSGYRDGEYESYEKHEYALDSDLVLRGIPKLDASNNLYYDGDIYKPDGTVERRYGVVDLGTLTWNKSSSGRMDSENIAGAHSYTATNDEFIKGIICSRYVGKSELDENNLQDKGIMMWGRKVYVYDTSYTDTVTFKAAMSGVYLVYELAEPTTEQAQPYTSPQIVDDFGTEEYVDGPSTASTPTRDVAIPVGHNSKYLANLRDKLQHLPDLADEGNGNYVVAQSGSQLALTPLVIPTELPTSPTEDGTYHLKVTVADGTATLSWEVEE